MNQVTRDIDPDSGRDLLERVPRACVAFASDSGPQTQPVALVWRDGRYLTGFPAGASRLPGAGQEVVLLIDEGVHYFELRAISIRGEVKLAGPPEGALSGRAWFEVIPRKTVAWDYGELREARDEG